MRLVDTDTAGPADDAEAEVVTPPRPERRRVSVSLILTLAVLVGIVVVVYGVFPERHNALMTAAIAAHRADVDLELVEPAREELLAWSMALLGRDTPLPELAADVKIVGARAMTVLNRRAAMVRYRIAGDVVTLVVQRPRDTPPRKHRRADGDQLCLSWRSHRFTFIAVGPAQSVGRWARYFGAPAKFIPSER
jgi:hypothetical protein